MLADLFGQMLGSTVQLVDQTWFQMSSSLLLYEAMDSRCSIVCPVVSTYLGHHAVIRLFSDGHQAMDMRSPFKYVCIVDPT